MCLIMQIALNSNLPAWKKSLASDQILPNYFDIKMLTLNCSRTRNKILVIIFLNGDIFQNMARNWYFPPILKPFISSREDTNIFTAHFWRIFQTDLISFFECKWSLSSMNLNVFPRKTLTLSNSFSWNRYVYDKPWNPL